MEFPNLVDGLAEGPVLVQQNFVTNNSYEINSTVLNQAQIIETNVIMVAEARHEQVMRAAEATHASVVNQVALQVEESRSQLRDAGRRQHVHVRAHRFQEFEGC